MADAIAVRGLSKYFGTVRAVDDVALNVPEAGIFGFLGPNAAGKSTTLRLLAGILKPTRGGGTVLGHDLLTQAEQIKRDIGYVAQHFGLYPELTVAENLAFYSRIYPGSDRRRDRALLEHYGLAEFAKRRAGALSGGYKRRLAIVCALAHEPALIFLDEPTAGIDPVSRKVLWELFYDLAAAGRTLFVTTHYMEEAERCHRLAFIHRGSVIATGTPDQIRRQVGPHRVYAIAARYDPQLAARLHALEGVLLLNQYGEQLRVIAEASVTREALATIAGAATPVEPTVEDAFMTLTRSTT